ncbi:MAG: pseudouridine synthase [Ignavibacteriales bacterium]|nr:pseudouridine synthase [Ignavibacteriales bacterium]
MNKNCYIILNKPYATLCQFTDSEGRDTLGNYGPFPKDLYPAGRLDADSEGLVLLTNDGLLKSFLLEPRYKHPRTYLAQIERIPSEESLEKLRNGIIIEKKKTLPAEIRMLKEEPVIPPRPVPVRFRKNVPTCWLEIKLIEGRNRQVRKMTAAIGNPTLRLIRIMIDTISMEGLNPGESRELTEQEQEALIYSVRKIKPDR